MKKLRFFDSLKFVVAVVAATLILNVAHADTTAIQSVIAYGKTEPSGTPTPDAPVDIVSNNGVLKVSKNLFDGQWEYGNIDSSGPIGSASQYVRSVNFIPVSPSTQYMLSTNNEAALGGEPQFYTLEYDSSKKFITNTRTQRNNVARSADGVLMTTTASTAYIKVFYYSAQKNYTTDTSQFNFQIEKGSIKTEYHPYGEVYVEGTQETIGDSANHTATVATLLGVGDYRDTQNINTGAITRNVGVKVLDGTEGWIKGMQSFYVDGIVPDSSAATDFIPFCTHYLGMQGSSVASSLANTNTIRIYIGSGTTKRINIFAILNDYPTVEDFKSYLAQQYANGTPVIVVYPLKTPTTETVAGQSLTTAPVRQTAGSILGMPIEVVFGDGTREWVSEIITIATTKYNEEQFAPVKTDLSAAVNAVEYVVSNTMTQAQAIDTIATTKQTRPDEGCMAKYCLLVEDEDGTPHWYPIAGANGVEYVLPSGYTRLEYIESTGTQYIDTGINKAKFIHDIAFTVRNNTNLMGNSESGGSYWGQARKGQDGFELAKGRIYTNSLIRQTIIFDTNAEQTTLTANNETISYNNTVSGGKTYYLFRINNSSSFYCSARLWGFEAYDQNDTLIQNLIPAKRNSDNEIGMYDTVSGQFFTNAGTGTGTFTAGPDM